MLKLSAQRFSWLSY